MTSPVSLNRKTTSRIEPSFISWLPFSITAEALSLPPMMTRPCAGTVTALEPLAGVSFTLASEPGSVIDSRVCGFTPSLKIVRATTAGPFTSGFGCVMTFTFCSFRLSTEVAALSGLIWRVCASLPAPQAESEAIEKTMAAPARAPRRRLLLTAALLLLRTDGVVAAATG